MAEIPAATEHWLEIDQHPFPIDGIAILVQDDPWPAGHRFQLAFTLRKPFSGLEMAGNFPRRDVSADESRELLSTISWLYLPDKSAKADLRYFLNRIETFSSFDGRFAANGICSRVLAR